MTWTKLSKSTLALGVFFAAPLLAAFPNEDSALDRGASGVWQKLLKLQTTASVLHTHPHPDDEQGGLLTLLSRGLGVRTSVLTMNRGEGGANAIGSELFDALGLLRTEELLLANRSYGVDQQYFTTTADYGFSKRLEEASEKWGDRVLRDVVRVVRMNRPLVLISRSVGNQRNGQGDPETDSRVTEEAFRIASDPSVFPEQIAAGLRPWQPLKIYVGGQPADGEWAVRINPGEYNPRLGETYSTLAREGLAFERSQNSGRVAWSRGPQYAYYKRVGSRVASGKKEEGFFDGIDTTIPGLFKTLGRAEPPDIGGTLRAIDREIASAMSAFNLNQPSATVPFLARGLQATRNALSMLGATEPDASFILATKEGQFEAAINAALGIDFMAIAQTPAATSGEGALTEFVAPAAMGDPIPGQTFEIRALFTNRSSFEVEVLDLTLATTKGWTTKPIGPRPTTLVPAKVKDNDTISQRFSVTLADDAPLSSKPYFTRPSIRQSYYDVSDQTQLHRPSSEPPAVAVVRYAVLGVEVTRREVVKRREANLPYGFENRELRLAPALSLAVTPVSAITPLKARNRSLNIEVNLLSNVAGVIEGDLFLRLPAGWSLAPSILSFKHTRAGERGVYKFTVTIPDIEATAYEIRAVARALGREYTEGYDVIRKRDLETRLFYRPSTIQVRGVDVAIPANLKVGYVMGAGDQVPEGIAQLGAAVTLLGTPELSTGDLAQFDTIMTGIRAYAVRDDLKTYNRRLLDYVKGGGNLVVLYNTPEFDPNQWAPYPAELPRNAEEVSEENSPVEILAPTASVFNFPNRITEHDFDDWVEQRGSKFFSAWDQAYQPMIGAWDKGQEKQRGGWLHATYGRGHYTYFAYALHRQLPYGVPGAYRLLANLLSLNKGPS